MSAGPAGLAIFAQFQNIIQILVQSSQLGILSGYTKYLVNYNRKKILRDNLKNTTLTILSLGTALSLIIMFAFSEKIIIAVDYSGNTHMILYAVAAAIFFYNLGAYLIATLVGLEFPVRASLLNFLQTFFLILITLPMSYLFGLTGAIIGLILSQVLWSISAVFFTKIPRVVCPEFSTTKFSYGIGKRLAGYMLSGLIVAIAGPLSLFLIRTNSIQVLGADQVGLWQALQSISAIYMSMVAMIITTFYYPKFSASKHRGIKRSAILVFFEATIFSSMLFLIFAIGLYLFGTKIISIAFTDEFMLAADYIIFQIFGDFFRVITIIISYFLLARGEQVKFIILELFSAISFFLLFHMIIESDIIDIFYSYIISGLATILTACILLTITFRQMKS
ncbi:hypothetical protein N9K21_04550 [Amylibacter sp.]|nr:hypothetical protein [Amylibacter sp.]